MIEVLIYRIEDEKLLCGGRTRSLEPSSTRSMTAEIVKEVREALLKDGLIPKPKKVPSGRSPFGPGADAGVAEASLYRDVRAALTLA